MTLTGTTATINGSFGPMKNPFSTVLLTMINIRYYSVANGGCSSSTPTF